jgi:hypothetical protein
MVTSRYVILSSLSAALLANGVAACKRADTLSALPSPNGEMLLIDALVGTDDRIICVASSLSDRCSTDTSDLYVTDLSSPNDLRAAWINENSVRIEINSGHVVRFNSVSKRGGVKIKLVTLQEPAL